MKLCECGAPTVLVCGHCEKRPLCFDCQSDNERCAHCQALADGVPLDDDEDEDEDDGIDEDEYNPYDENDNEDEDEDEDEDSYH